MTWKCCKPPLCALPTRYLLRVGLFALMLYNIGLLDTAADEAHQARHPVQISEILALERPSSVQVAPDGSMIAYVVTRASLQKNEDQTQLYVCSTSSCSDTKPLATGSRITFVRWYNDSQTLSYVVEADCAKEIWRSRFDGSAQKRLVGNIGHGPWQSRIEVPLPYEISPDGSMLVYASYDDVAADADKGNTTAGGVLYTGEFVQPLSYLEYPRLLVNLWMLDIRTQHLRKLWTTESFGPLGFTLPEFRFSNDGASLALLYPQPGIQHYTLALLSVTSGIATPLSAQLGFSHNIRWSADGRSLLFYSEGELTGGDTRRKAGFYAFQLSDNSLRELSSDRASVRLSYEASSEPAIRVEAASKQNGGIPLSSCSIDKKATVAACIQEAPMIPPEVVTVRLDHGTPVEAPRRLTQLNQPYNRIELGRMSRLSWPNRDGEGSAGLILPVGFAAGRQYPLLVMLYNMFSGRTFIADAGGFTSYPAQAFAGSGYVVLLMNVPHYYLFKPGDFASAKRVAIDAVVADIRSAVEILKRRGIVDPSKMGIMGWSGGCFWTNYIITHHPTWFKAASSGECAVHYPGQYWLGDDHWRQQEDNFFGGGPFGPFSSRWRQISPVLNADRLRVPLLMEYSVFYPAGLEMRTAVIQQGGQTELVIYPDDTHVLQRPLNRLNSMTRNFDWFNFWLRRQEDPKLDKHKQYARWQEMRRRIAVRELQHPNDGTESYMLFRAAPRGGPKPS
jgi:dipeptidyl aminopeptidase/acylaminoacyl peptidase